MCIVFLHVQVGDLPGSLLPKFNRKSCVKISSTVNSAAGDGTYRLSCTRFFLILCNAFLRIYVKRVNIELIYKKGKTAQ